MRDQKPGVAKDLRTGGDASVGTVSIDTGYVSSLVETAGAAVRTVGKVDSVSLISNLGDGTGIVVDGKVRCHRIQILYLQSPRRDTGEGRSGSGIIGFQRLEVNHSIVVIQVLGNTGGQSSGSSVFIGEKKGYILEHFPDGYTRWHAPSSVTAFRWPPP